VNYWSAKPCPHPFPQKSKNKTVSKSSSVNSSYKYENDNFYEISNTHRFEITSNIIASNRLATSYNSYSISNSNLQIEITHTASKNIKSEALNKNSDNSKEQIHEEIDSYKNSEIENKNLLSKKTNKIEETEEDYNDFDYNNYSEASPTKYNNKIDLNYEEESEILEEIN
jgi:hypothetical protein